MSKHEEIKGRVIDRTTNRPIEGARVEIDCGQNAPEGGRKHFHPVYSDAHGQFTAPLPTGCDEGTVTAHAFGCQPGKVDFSRDYDVVIRLDVESKFNPTFNKIDECGDGQACQSLVANSSYVIKLPLTEHIRSLEWVQKPGISIEPMSRETAIFTAYSAGKKEIAGTLVGDPWDDPPHDGPRYAWSMMQPVLPSPPVPVPRISLQRSAVRPTREENLWTLIRANSRALDFERYRSFINKVLCGKKGQHNDVPEGIRLERERNELSNNVGVGAYELLRTATDLFLLLNCRTHGSRHIQGEEFLEEETSRRQLATTADLTYIADQYLGTNNPYVQQVIAAAFPEEHLVRELQDGSVLSDGMVLREEPCLIELIWSYWHEEAMLTQSVNVLTRRFQNRGAGVRDPLAHFELDPLRPLNNILWGYVQEEHRRLTVPRRSLEYSHHYGLTLFGKANPQARPADPRSNFLESFHNLLLRCSQFFKEDNDTTVIADGFPLLNALKEVHLVLSQGAHNQFGDLPWTARGEMLIQQWIMARPETRDFLQSRAMVRYTEAWMPQVDTMKTIQGWTDVTVERFHDLASCGEQILASIRWGNWAKRIEEDVAKNWARYWRPEIQTYQHSYRAATGVELFNVEKVDFTLPAVHLQRRLEAQLRPR